MASSAAPERDDTSTSRTSAGTVRGITNQSSKQTEEGTKQEPVRPIISLRSDSELLEAIIRLPERECRLVALKGGKLIEHRAVSIAGFRYVPYSPWNNLLTHRVILLPSGAETYGTQSQLLSEVQAFLHRYVDLDPEFEEIAAHYVLMTWGYDVFNELPYLRVRGGYGCGKSRFLMTVGSICYKPIFASGASTVSPIFRLIDEIGGTLVIDEADFRASDERTEIVKILNNGNARGFPVLRSDVTPNKEFSPRAFDIFGPKLVATRHEFEDEALESRCLTQELGHRALRDDIPISLPRIFETEAQRLRNKLLMFRLTRFSAADELVLERRTDLPPRRAQILAPLLRMAVHQDAVERMVGSATRGFRVTERLPFATERRVLESASKLLGRSSRAPISLTAIARQFDDDWSHDGSAETPPRWIGSILRRLGVEPQKSHGVYVIPPTDYPQLRDLIDEYLGDIGENGARPRTDGTAWTPSVEPVQ